KREIHRYLTKWLNIGNSGNGCGHEEKTARLTKWRDTKMKISNEMFLLNLFAILLLATSVWAASSGDSKLDQAVAKANSEWAAAMKTGDAAIIAAPYAEDGVFVGIDGSCIKGRPEIQKMYSDRFQSRGFAVSTKIDSRRLTRDGDLAYESGYAEIGMNHD